VRYTSHSRRVHIQEVVFDTVIAQCHPNIKEVGYTANMTPSLPKTFKAALFKKADESLTVVDLELKEPGEGEILIKVLATGVCHSDVMVQAGVLGSPL
jgi:hypothetical protein